jgi:hypothetical protein
LVRDLRDHMRLRDGEIRLLKSARRGVSVQARFERQNELDIALHKWVLDTFNDTWGNPAWRVGQVPALERAQPQMAEPTGAAGSVEQLAQLLACGLRWLIPTAGDNCNKRATATADGKEPTPRLAGDNSGGFESIEAVRQLESGNERSSHRKLATSEMGGPPISSREHAQADGNRMTVFLHMHKSAGTTVRAHNAAPRLCLCPGQTQPCSLVRLRVWRWSNKPRVPHGATTLTRLVSGCSREQMCKMAMAQPSVRITDFQQVHNCNANHEGPNTQWHNPLLTSCQRLYELQE